MTSANRNCSSVSAHWWLADPLAAVVFGTSLIGFAAARTDGYSHASKAVSELGSVGAPAALAFNLAGLILPGALVAMFGLLLGRATVRRAAPLLLVASGLCLALAGVAPVDMDDLGATSSVWHFVGAMGSGLLWLPALLFCAPMLSRDFGLWAWGRITPLFCGFLLGNVAWQVAYQSGALIMPGWGQRIGFFGYFLWFAITGCLLWRAARKRAFSA